MKKFKGFIQGSIAALMVFTITLGAFTVSADSITAEDDICCGACALTVNEMAVLFGNPENYRVSGESFIVLREDYVYGTHDFLDDLFNDGRAFVQYGKLVKEIWESENLSEVCSFGNHTDPVVTGSYDFIEHRGYHPNMCFRINGYFGYCKACNALINEEYVSTFYCMG